MGPCACVVGGGPRPADAPRGLDRWPPYSLVRCILHIHPNANARLRDREGCETLCGGSVRIDPPRVDDSRADVVSKCWTTLDADFNAKSCPPSG